MSNISQFSLNTGPITKETNQIAISELRETPENITAALVELRNLINNGPHLHFCNNDEFLIMFLRPCKFHAKSAYAKVII